MSNPTLPLDGVTVVEAAGFISGPFATMMLADLGADVVKVEPPRGDPLRRFGRPAQSMSAPFLNTNRNKRSLALDLKSGDGRGALLALLAQADVFVCNWRPAVAQRLGLADEVVSAANHRLVRIYLSGFGTTGPDADQPVFDSIIQARAAMTDTQSHDGKPTVMPSYIADKLAASMAAQAALAALVARARTGRGERVDLAMLDAASYLNFPDALANRTFLDDAPADARNRQAAAVRPVATADGHLVVVPVTADQVRRTAAAVGRPAWGHEVLGLADAEEMNRRLLDGVEAATRTASTAHWLALFAEHDVPAAPCLTIDEHLTDRQVGHNRIYAEHDWPGIGRVRQVRYPAVFASAGLLGVRCPPPLLGEHDDEIAAPTRRA